MLTYPAPLQLPSGTPVELGATWFHGVRDNPVYDMAVWQGVVKDVRMDPGAVPLPLGENWLPAWRGAMALAAPAAAAHARSTALGPYQLQHQRQRQQALASEGVRWPPARSPWSQRRPPSHGLHV